jgi:hypothetical protein
VNAREVRQVILEMRSAVQLSLRFGTPVADQQLLLDWADQLEQALRATPQAVWLPRTP